MNSRVIIDACTPWNRRDTWPEVVRNTPGLEKQVREKFGKFLPQGW
jgi:3-polyprenyl-4-hydroxybenzoate decarboxylase